MKRNNISKQELRIRKQMSEITSYIQNREEANRVGSKIMLLNEPEALKLDYIEKFEKKYPEATKRVATQRLTLRGKTIDEIVQEDAEIGNYPMTKERLLELLNFIPESMFTADEHGQPMIPLRESVALELENNLTASRMYAIYLKEVKQFIQA